MPAPTPPIRPLARHTLWVGFAAVLLPLAVLLAVQYNWLVQLGEKSRLAHKATLAASLEKVTDKVEYFYRGQAESLNVYPALFTQHRLDKASWAFGKSCPEAASRVFVLSFVEEKPSLHFYDRQAGAMVKPEWSPDVRAVYAATASLQVLAHKGGTVDSAALQPVQIDGRYLLLHPVLDEAWRLVGVSGMILDPAYFRGQLLPRMIVGMAPAIASGYGPGDLEVTVRDGSGSTVFSWPEEAVRLKKAPGAGPAQPDIQRAFSPVFPDWRIGLTSRRSSPAHLARRSFVLNLGLAALLSAALLAGIALALRTASREMKLSQMKSDFVSNVSHELRTPLASIRVFGELLRLGRFEGLDKAREYGEYIETESRRLTQLINNLLDFASIESGRKSYRFERADVAEVVADTLKTFEVRLRQSGFRIAYEGPSGSLPPVRLDPGAIAQALSNLLDNAVKYSNGGREIAVALSRREGYVVLAVRDQGVGIPRDEQKKIFDRFHRVSTGLVHDVKGSGLGLAIVRHIVEAHGGWVTVDSRPGEGSTFAVHLPAEPVAGEKPASPGPAASPGRHGPGGGPDRAARPTPSEA